MEEITEEELRRQILNFLRELKISYSMGNTEFSVTSRI